MVTYDSRFEIADTGNDEHQLELGPRSLVEDERGYNYESLLSSGPIL